MSIVSYIDLQDLQEEGVISAPEDQILGSSILLRINTNQAQTIEGEALPRTPGGAITLGPRQSAVLVTRERFQLPDDLTAILAPVTHRPGSPPLDVGLRVVAPCYGADAPTPDGLGVSFRATNLSDEPLTLSADDFVAEAVFLRHEPIGFDKIVIQRLHKQVR